MESLVSALNAVVWSPALIYLLLGAGLFYSALTRFMQLRLTHAFDRMVAQNFPAVNVLDPPPQYRLPLRSS